jgi:hypothetical protein
LIPQSPVFSARSAHFVFFKTRGSCQRIHTRKFQLVNPPHRTGLRSRCTKLTLSLSALTYEDESSEIRDDDPTDCLSDRQTALMDGGQFYIPECTPDGRYKKVNNVAMDRPIRLDQTNIANV